jgi:hypothetical protein
VVEQAQGQPLRFARELENIDLVAVISVGDAVSDLKFVPRVPLRHAPFQFLFEAASKSRTNLTIR